MATHSASTSQAMSPAINVAMNAKPRIVSCMTLKKKNSILNFFQPKREANSLRKSKSLFKLKSLIFPTNREDDDTSTTGDIDTGDANNTSDLNQNTDKDILVPTEIHHEHLPPKSLDHPRLSSTTTNSTVTTKYRIGHSSSLAKLDHLQVEPQDFKKIQLIGRGDVGRVYLVENVKNDHLYAMKVLSKKEMVAREKVKRVLAEQRILVILLIGNSESSIHSDSFPYISNRQISILRY